MKAFTTSFASLVIHLLGLGVCVAHDHSVGDIRIENAWSRPLPAVSANGVAYMKIHNRGDGPDRLISASTPAAERAELHTHVHQDGMMQMRPVEAIEVPAGGSAVLEPGGLHVMLMGLRSPMSEGREFPLTLRFERAGAVEVTVEVKKSAEAAMKHEGHDQGPMNMDHDQHREMEQ